jgi:hypothetical protein
MNQRPTFPSRREERSLRIIFAIPALLASTSVLGLAAALIGDGWFDAIGWIGLGIPISVTAWFLCKR